MKRKPTGRHHNINRQAALVVGDRTYTGKKCKRCGATERYTKGASCVACQKHSAIEARQLLRAARAATVETRVEQGAARVQQLFDSAEAAKPLADDLEFLNELNPENLGAATSQLDQGIIVKELEEGDENGRFAAPCSTQTKTAGASPPDPEPLCPECGCNVEADYFEVVADGGKAKWLQRCSPWRCSICDWVDSTPAIDSLDFLG